jgi:hypothetical protein
MWEELLFNESQKWLDIQEEMKRRKEERRRKEGYWKQLEEDILNRPQSQPSTERKHVKAQLIKNCITTLVEIKGLYP